MNWAIHFDNQLRFGTIEVNDETLDGMLSAKLEPTALLASKV